ncbi:EF-hand calcium-binding domain-containing protein 6 [Betta splendens]|uniref:EF-hand calcium-binding domain-containing protein 6 n=1 Tax=Betta splendens TaxID=158456 RepID=A0A6P7NEF4_BETSP|nr:EF-hand calcium-binding domain-containing protein 6 [Betta splendens]
MCMDYVCESSYGVRATGLIRWKHFLGHFMSPSKEDQDTKPPSGRSSKQSDADGQTFNFNDIYPQLKDIFYQLDLKEGGSITQADLRRLLQKPDGTHPQTPHRFLHHSRIKELFNVLDPEHTGLIQQANLERLNPSFTPAPTSNTAPTPSLDNAPEPLSISEETKYITADTEEQKTADQMETKQWADKVSSASWRTVESPLLDNLSQQLRSLQVVLEQFDPQHTGYVMQEDLTKALSCCGVADAHFNKTCTSSPLALKPVSGQRPLSSSQDRIETCYIPHIVFQRMRSRLEQHHTSLTDRIQAIIPNPETVDLTETNLKKILEDSWVILDEENFNEFAKCLGVTDGRIRLSVFQAKYEEAMGSTGDHLDSGSSNCEKKKIGPLLTSAEQCLAALKTRIKFIYGNTFAAFRLMDRKCRGMVNSHDFKVLYQSLGFFCSKAEYNKLLDRIGLRPGANLNYAEFVNVIENNGKQEAPSTNILDQLHELLASDARYKWADMSKVLCQVDSDGHSRVDKKSLRRLLFTYALPIRHSEFDQLWSRYDAEGRGFLAVCDFLGKLGLHHKGDKLNLTVSQPDLPIFSDSASLEQVKHILQENHEELSGALTNLDTRKDGTVTVEEVLSLLHGYGCYTPREQFVRHLQRLCISMNDNTKRLHYMDFLSGFVPEVEKNEPPPPGAVLQIESLDSLSPDMALAKMRERVAFSAPSLYKAFSAFDQNGKGTVTVLEFRRVLDSFCARLSEKQYRHLLTKLELDCENSTVNWKDFLKKFKISDKNLSRSTEKESIPSSLVYKEISGNTELPQQILEVASDHQIEITKELVGADVSNTVSKEHLQHLCAWHRPDLSNDQLEHMWRQMPATEQRELQCGEFEKHSARTGRTQSAPQGTSRHPASVGRPGTGSPPGSMERRLHGALRRCWKEIQRKCATEDSQRAGRISTGSFLGILQSLNISVTQEQFEDLAAKYGCVNNGCVLYHTFLQRFLLNLNPAETAKAFERLKLPLPATPMSQGVLTKDCTEVMFRTYDVVHSSWSSIRRCFLALDRGRTGSVSVQDFRKVLCHFGVTLSEDEFFHLCSYLDANATGKICYNDFLWVFLH